MVPRNQYELLPKDDDPVITNVWIDENPKDRHTLMFLLRYLVENRYSEALASLFPYRMAAFVKENVLSHEDIDEMLSSSRDIAIQKIHSEWKQYRRRRC